MKKKMKEFRLRHSQATTSHCLMALLSFTPESEYNNKKALPKWLYTHTLTLGRDSALTSFWCIEFNTLNSHLIVTLTKSQKRRHND